MEDVGEVCKTCVCRLITMGCRGKEWGGRGQADLVSPMCYENICMFSLKKRMKQMVGVKC